MEAKLGVKPSDINTMHAALNKLLSMHAVLYTNTLKAHWNVVGPAFSELHKLFGKQYEFLFNNMDTIAERIRAMGKFPVADMSEWMKMGDAIPELKATGAMEMVSSLLQGHEVIIREMRVVVKKAEELSEVGTVNMLSSMVEQQEKVAWMLRAHVETAKR